MTGADLRHVRGKWLLFDQVLEGEGVQAHHMARCLVADLVFKRERMEQGITRRQLRRQLIVKRLSVSLPALKRVSMAA
jgi:hypothetical protein